ncbi:hypothetical protein V8C43DRAFT_59280 [Trichoderma afarasin]
MYRRWPGTCARGRTHQSPATWYLSANTHSVTDPCGAVMHNCTLELTCLTGTRELVAGWLCLAFDPSHLFPCCTSYQKHSPWPRSRHDCDSKADAHRESRALHVFLSLLTAAAIPQPSSLHCCGHAQTQSFKVPKPPSPNFFTRSSPCPPPFALPNGNKTPPCPLSFSS